jgi:molybdopterin molybdotransferase
MITLVEARDRILVTVRRLGSERVSLAEAAGRVLAAPAVASHELPPTDGSAMDGYAVRVADFAGPSPHRLPVAAGESRAGRPAAELAPGYICRIFTGAALPKGANAVVMQEEVVREGDWATFASPPRRGQHVRAAGEDLRAGDLAIPEGTRLHAGHVALAASIDCAELVVARAPTVAILCTGDELRTPGTAHAAGPAAIADSNGVALAALVRQAGGRPRLLPVVRDDLDGIVAALDDALAGSDLVLTVGGVSVGDHDLVRPALDRIGVTLDFYKVAIKPGKPVAFGIRPGARPTRLLGLPGNPASALTTFALFGAPLVRAMQGDAAPIPMPLPARVGAPIRHKPGRLELVRVTLDRLGTDIVARPLANQASGATTSMGWASAFALVPLEADDLAEGAAVDVLRLADV